MAGGAGRGRHAALQHPPSDPLQRRVVATGLRVAVPRELNRTSLGSGSLGARQLLKHHYSNVSVDGLNRIELTFKYFTGTPFAFKPDS